MTFKCQIRFTRGVRMPGQNCPLEWVRVRVSHPKGIVFAPPLIGGVAAQQVRLFRSLIRSGYDLVTFSFSGHGASAGRFSLSSSVGDTCRMLDRAAAAAAQEKLPLFGVASSYSAIPLLSAAGRRKEPLQRLVLINPLPRIRISPVVRSYIRFHRHVRKSSAAGGAPIAESMEQFLSRLFPSVWRGWRQFGTLERSRTKSLQIVAETLLTDPLFGVSIRRTPVLCLYGLEDKVIRLFHPDLALDFKPLIRSICPKVRFQALPCGHFLRSRRRRAIALGSILRFFLLDPTQSRA